MPLPRHTVCALCTLLALFPLPWNPAQSGRLMPHNLERARSSAHPDPSAWPAHAAHPQLLAESVATAS